MNELREDVVRFVALEPPPLFFGRELEDATCERDGPRQRATTKTHGLRGLAHDDVRVREAPLRAEVSCRLARQWATGGFNV